MILKATWSRVWTFLLQLPHWCFRYWLLGAANWAQVYDELWRLKSHDCSDVPTELHLQFHSHCKSSTYVFQYLYYSDWRVPVTLSFDNSLEWFTEFRKMLCLWLWFYYKRYELGLTKEEMHRKRFGRVSNVNLLCHRMYLLSRHICVPHQPGWSPEPRWTEQRFY